MKKAPGTEFCGVILAAGLGSRIKPLSLAIPKPLLPVGNKPIMQYQIEEMKAVGIRDIVIVVGHLKDKIIGYFGDGSRWGVRLSYVEQREALGIAHAVGQLESHVQRPFLLWLGDIFFIPKDIGRMLREFRERRACAVLAVKEEPDPERIKKNFAVLLHESGLVKRVVEKPRYLSSRLKGCGIYLFDLAIFDAIRRTPRTAMRDEYEITNSIQILIEDGFPVYPADVVEWDMNITYASDLLLCNRLQLRRAGLERIVHPTAKVHAGARIKGSVIGEGVVVSRPVRIEDSVVLAGTRWTASEDIVSSLVAGRTVLHEAVTP
jgi:NDP-sugar pyrophosphorylase family protein